MKPEILRRETTHSGYLTVERLRVRLASGAEVTREMERHGDAVAVLPYDPVGRVALIVRLFRVPAFVQSGDLALDEACAGMIDQGTAADATRREALEELGVRLSVLEPVAQVWSSPGVSAERVSLFLAPFGRADRVGPGGGVDHEHEAITVLERPLAELAGDVRLGRITDMKLFALVLALQARRPELFGA
jgi:nudix-type nucleoside diphosphatase (YffH/AdpP family)